jgi:type I phosphodiesterase/nucleotide pyrophosphatase
VAGQSLDVFRERTALRLGRAVALLAVLSACGHSASRPTEIPPSSALAPPSAPRVVIFSIDGLRPDALIQAAPILFGLAASGAYSWQAQTIMPSTTLPSHASMLSGYLPAVHGITWDDYRPERGAISVPTVFSAARAAGLRTVLVAGKEKFRQLDVPGMVQRFDLCASDDEQVASRAMGEALAGFDLMFVHLPQPDLAGHAQGWMSPAYLDAVAGADRAVGRVLAVLPVGTTVIVTADHGGHDWNHGTNMGADTTIPWIVSGPRVRPRALATRVHTTDTAATAAWVLGFSLPAGASGRPVLEAFETTTATAAKVAVAVHVPAI